MSEQEKNKLEAITDNIEKEIDVVKVEELIKNNIGKFDYEGVEYRTRNATFKEKQEAYKRKVEKYTELLQNPKNLLEEDLRKLYKERGINIDDLTAQINTLEANKANLQFKLGQSIKENQDDSILETLKEEIDNIDREQMQISMTKTNWLQTSIESQVLIYVYQYLTYAVTEKLVKDGEEERWVKAWDNYEDFLNSDDALVNKASFQASLIIGQV